MSQKSPPKQMLVGWKIIGHILLQAGIPKENIKRLSHIWIDIYTSDHDFNSKVIAKRLLAEMKNSLLSEDKLREKLESAKISYSHLLFESNSEQSVMEPEGIIFNSLLKNIILRLKEKVEITDLHDDLSSDLTNLHLSANSMIEMERWSMSLMKAMPEENIMVIELKDIKSFVHYLYTWTCEELGPTIADQLFAEAIRVVEMLPESGKCHPKSFL